MRPILAIVTVHYSVVCLSVTNLSPAKTSEPIETPFRVWTQGTVYGMGSRYHMWWGNFEGHVICMAYYYYYYKRWCLGCHYHAQNVAGPPNKQSRVNSDAAQALASSPKDVLKSTVFSCCRKAANIWRSTILLQRNPSFGETFDQVHFSCWICLVSDTAVFVLRRDVKL